MLMAAVAKKIFRSGDGGRSWSSQNSASSLSLLTTDPSTRTVYAAAVTDTAGSDPHASTFLYQSNDFGQSFFERGYTPFLEAAKDIAVDPHDSARIYLGTGFTVPHYPKYETLGSLYLAEPSTNPLEGLVWTKLSSFPSRVVVVGPDPQDKNVIYVGTSLHANSADGAGLFKSTDRGEHFASIGPSGVANILDIAINPTATNIIYVASDRQGVFLSEDAGSNWRAFNAGLGTRFVYDIEFDPRDPSILYAATKDRAVYKLFRGTGCEEDRDCDASLCTVARCAPGHPNADGRGCVIEAEMDGVECDDNDACTRVDTCQGGQCVGADSVACSATDQCYAVGICDPRTGICSNPAVQDGIPCDDGDACTLLDECHGGTCVVSESVACSAIDACHAAGTCDPSTGLCSNPARDDGSPCDDENACTETDVCQAGECVGTNPVVCKAAGPCYDRGSCDPGTGVCSTPPLPDGTACSDGSFCDGDETCRAGACTSGVPPCSADGCDEAGKRCENCGNGSVDQGEECDDGNSISGDGCETTCHKSICYGDCSSDLVVTEEEIRAGITLIFDETGVPSCPSFDVDGDDRVRSHEIVRAVANAIFGCARLISTPNATIPEPTHTEGPTGVALTPTAMTTVGTPAVTASPRPASTATPTPTPLASSSAVPTPTASATVSGTHLSSTATPAVIVTSTPTNSSTPTRSPMPTPTLAIPVIDPARAQVTVFTNPGDSQLARIETDQGVVIESFGVHEKDGTPQRMTALRVGIPDGDDTVQSLLSYDQLGRPRHATMDGSALTLDFEWDQEGANALVIRRGTQSRTIVLGAGMDSAVSAASASARTISGPSQDLDGEIRVTACGTTQGVPFDKIQFDATLTPFLLSSNIDIYPKREGDGWRYTVPRPGPLIDPCEIGSALGAKRVCESAHVESAVYLTCFVFLAEDLFRERKCKAIALMADLACGEFLESIGESICNNITPEHLNRVSSNEDELRVSAYLDLPGGERVVTREVTDQPVTLTNLSDKLPTIELDFDVAEFGTQTSLGPVSHFVGFDGCGAFFEVGWDALCPPAEETCIECTAHLVGDPGFTQNWPRTCAEPGETPRCYPSGAFGPVWPPPFVSSLYVGVGEKWIVDVSITDANGGALTPSYTMDIEHPGGNGLLGEFACLVSGAVLRIGDTRPAPWVNLPGRIELSGLAPAIAPLDYTGNGDVFFDRSACAFGEEGGSDRFSFRVPSNAVLYPVNVAGGVPYEVSVGRSARKNCSSFIAVRNLGTPDYEIWINATIKFVQPTGGSQVEYQTRYYSGDPENRGGTRFMEVGRVSSIGLEFSRDFEIADFDAELRFSTTPK